jgi:hypothetical protein
LPRKTSLQFPSLNLHLLVAIAFLYHHFVTDFALSVATTPEGMICDSCVESMAGRVLPVRRLLVSPDATPACDYCGDPIDPEFGPINPEDLSY